MCARARHTVAVVVLFALLLLAGPVRPGFAAELMLKDLGLSQQAAEAVDAATPLGAQAAAIFEEFVAMGGRGRDFSGILPWMVERHHGS